MASLTHTYTFHVFWDDTDAGGIVYHANYLKFMDRARSTWLLDQGIRQATMLQDQGVVFVVAKAQVHYKAPAFLDDDLTVESTVVNVRRASLTFEQVVKRGETPLARGTIELVAINRRGVPCAMPEPLYRRFTS